MDGGRPEAHVTLHAEDGIGAGSSNHSILLIDPDRRRGHQACSIGMGRGSGGAAWCVSGVTPTGTWTRVLSALGGVGG